MRSRLLWTAIGVTLCVSVGLTGIASAIVPAKTTVTIRAEGRDLSGRVKSPRPLRCADGRKVIVFRQMGSQQDPVNDQRVGMDTASLNGDHYEWSTGNTGLTGRFYARAPRTPQCKADSSETVRTT